jgi:hypothetical protein
MDTLVVSYFFSCLAVLGAAAVAAAVAFAVATIVVGMGEGWAVVAVKRGVGAVGRGQELSARRLPSRLPDRLPRRDLNPCSPENHYCPVGVLFIS